MSAPVVQANVIGTGLVLTSISYDYIGTAVAVEIDDGDIARRPKRIAEPTREREAALAVVKINDLFVQGVVTDDRIKVAVAVQVGERRGVRPIRLAAEVVPPVEAPLPVV